MVAIIPFPEKPETDPEPDNTQFLRDHCAHLSVLRLSSKSEFSQLTGEQVAQIGETIGLSGPEIDHVSGSARTLLDVWKERTDLSPTTGHLLEALRKTCCTRVLQRMKCTIASDIEAHNKYAQFPRVGLIGRNQGGEGTEVPFGTENDEGNDMTATLPRVTDVISESSSVGSEIRRIGRQMSHSRSRNPTIYEGNFGAVVSATENSKLADNIVEDLRREGIPVCDLRYDILPGSAINPTTAEIMDIRTQVIVIMLDKQYELSETCTFQVTFAQFLDPDAKRGKVIPLLLEAECPVPAILCPLEVLDFSSEEGRRKNLDRLVTTIRNNNETQID